MKKIIMNMDIVLVKRRMKLKDLAEKTGITKANLSIIKRGKAKAVRFSTLEKLCEVLKCQPSDLMEYGELDD